jgi:hypothetical protein
MLTISVEVNAISLSCDIRVRVPLIGIAGSGQGGRRGEIYWHSREKLLAVNVEIK